MIEPKCRLTLASRYYGGIFGGGSSPQTINPSQEYSKILNLTQQKTIPFYQNFIGSNPNIQAMQGIAGQQLGQLPGLENRLAGAYQAQSHDVPLAKSWLLGAYRNAFPEDALRNQLLSQYQSAVPTQQLTSPLMAGLNAPGGAAQTAALGGALTPQLTRQATQEAAARNAAAGMATTMPGLFGEALNRDVYRQQRYAQSIGEMLGLTQGVSQLDTAGLNRALGYTQGMEGLNTDELKRALSAGQAYTGYGQQGMGNLQQYISGLTGLQNTTAQGLANPLNTGIAAFTQLVNPASATVSSATNFNANAQQAAANNKSNTQGALIGAGAKIASAYGGG